MNYKRISLIYLRWILVIFITAFGIIAAVASGGGSDSDDNDNEQEQVASPQFSSAEGRYYNEQTITVTCATEGATISYTTDNTDPSETEGTTITSGESFGLSSTSWVKAIAYKNGMLDSEITSAHYIFPLCTWVSGDNTIEQSGVYGTKGTGDVSNKPGARDCCISWIDSSGNLWLFGGSGYDAAGNTGHLNDLWMFEPSSGKWTWVSGDSAVDQSGVYGTKGTGDASNIPGARAACISWIDTSGNLWLFGGNGCSDDAEDDGLLNDLWTFEPSSGKWTWVSGDSTVNQPGVYGTKGTGDESNKPGARSSGVSWIDTSGNLWLFGGAARDISGDTGYINDLWMFEPSSGKWTWVSGDNTVEQSGVYGTKGVENASNKPGGRAAAFSWKDSSGDLWLFGGAGYDSLGDPGYINDLWMFDTETKVWTWVSGDDTADQPGVYGTKGVEGASNKPGARAAGVSWIDSSGDLWLFGGEGFAISGGGLLNDLWRFDPSTGIWTWASGYNGADQPGVYGTKGTGDASNKPGARAACVSWIDSSGDLWLFGGIGYAATDSIGKLNDLWKF